MKFNSGCVDLSPGPQLLKLICTKYNPWDEKAAVSTAKTAENIDAFLQLFHHMLVLKINPVKRMDRYRYRVLGIVRKRQN